MPKHIRLDGRVGDAPTVHVTIDERGAAGELQRRQDFDLPCSEDQLRTLAHGILAGVPFSEANWVGRGSAFSTAGFRKLRAELLKRGIVAPINPDAPAQGYQFNRAGLAVLKYYADERTK